MNVLKHRSIFLVLVGILLLGPDVFGFTEEEEDAIRQGAANFKYHTVTTKEGLNFRVPEDLPIEKKDGLLNPLPFDEYMYGKFKQIDERLKSIELLLDRIDKTLAPPVDNSPQANKPKALKS